MPALDRAKTILNAEKYVKAGKFIEAVAEYRKLADDNPRDMNVLNKLGDLLARAGKNPEAMRCFQKIGEFYAKDGFFLKAIAIYKKVSKLDPANLECQQQLASLYHRQGLVSEAKGQYLLVAEQLMRKGQSKPAADMLQKVLEIEPDNHKVRTTLAELLGRASKGDGAREFCQVARTSIDKGSVAETLQALRKAVTADPGYPDLPSVLLALLTKIETTPKDLAPIAEEVCKAASKSGLAVVAAAESYRRAGRKAEAEAAFKRLEGPAFSPEELSAEAMLLVSRWNTGTGKEAEGYKWLHRATDRFVEESRLPEAAAALDAFLQGHSVHPDALSDRAAVAARAEDRDAEAATLFRLAPLLLEALESERAGEVVARLETLRPGDAEVRGLRARLGSPGGAPAAEDGEVPGSIPLAADDEEKGDEEFSLEMEPEPGAGAAESGDGLPAVEPEPEAKEGLSEEADYGPVSKIQEIQAADGDGRPIDEDFISEHLTEADVFAKYGLLAKAREQLLAILERYPKEMSAHQRLIEVHTGEGNTEAAVKECLLLADLKKADGKDAEVRELVNEAIRIAGPGSPLIERYAAALEAGGAVITPAPKTVTKAPPPAAQQAAPRAAAPKPSETKPAPARAPEPMIATPPPKAAAPAADDLEFEIEVPDEEETPAPAAVPDFAVTTARAAAIPAAKRVEEETPDDLLGLRDPAGEDALPLPHAIPATAPSDPDGEKLGEVDFYMEQGLTDEARQVLFQLRKQYPKSRTVAERLQRLEHPQGSAAPKARQAAEESNLDLEVEQALGGRAGAPEAAGKQEPHKPAPKAAPKASKARPVFKVERHQEGHDGDFVDLAKELDASLGEEPQRHASTAPDSLEGPGHSFDEVLAAFRKGVEQQVDQEDYDTHYNLGIAYKEMGLMDEAIGEFQFAARDPSRTLECCGILGLCFRDRGMPEIALKWYRRGLDMPGLDDQRAIGLRYDMAEAYREKGDLEQALKMYTEVYGVDSNYREVAARIKEVKGHLTSSARR